MKKAAKIVVGTLLGVALLALSLRGIEGRQVLEELRGASIGPMIASIAVGVGAHNLLRALRWRVLLSPEKPGIGLYNLFSTTMIGYAISWSLPLRLGEVMRPVLLAEREGIRVSAALTTVVIERFLDGLSVIALFAVAVTVWDARGAIGAGGETILRLAWMAGAFLLLASAALFGLLLAAVATRHRWEERLVEFASRRRGRLAGRAAHGVIGLIEGGAVLRRPGSMALIAALSLLIWLVIGASTWLGLLSGGIRLRFHEVFILLPASVLGIAVPTPGGAGSFELAVSAALHLLFGVPRETAFAATLILHVPITLVPVVLLGLVLLWRDGITFGRLRAALAASGGGSR